MKSHQKSIHQGLKYPCDECDYQATQAGNPWKHIKKMHDGIKSESPMQAQKRQKQKEKYKKASITPRPEKKT